MGDMGLVRRPPRGWHEGTVAAARFRTWTGEGGEEIYDIDTSAQLDVEWEVRVPGFDLYLLQEERKAPTWVEAGRGLGAGKRFYKVRLRRSGGLVQGLEIPCRVDPKDGSRVWIDWDAAYDLHVDAWNRGVPARKEPVRAEPAPPAPVVAASEPEHDAYIAAAKDAERIYMTGRKLAATVVSVTDTGAKLATLPVLRFELDLSDGRHVTHEQPVHRMSHKRYAVGKAIQVAVDPEDPARLTLT